MKNLIRFDRQVELDERSMFHSRSLTFFGGHQDEINTLVFSRDLEILLTASIDGCIRIWNTVYEHLTLKFDENAGGIERNKRLNMMSRNNRLFCLFQG